MQQDILEGTWEEIAAHAEELQGQRLRLTVLADESVTANGTASDEAAAALVRDAERRQGIRNFLARVKEVEGSSNGWKWNREELYSE